MPVTEQRIATQMLPPSNTQSNHLYKYLSQLHGNHVVTRSSDNTICGTFEKFCSFAAAVAVAYVMKVPLKCVTESPRMS